jgi:transposase-like protein
VGAAAGRPCPQREGVALTGEDGLLTSMVREVLQAGLDVEMADHLGYEPYESVGRGSGNSRNGSYQKTVKTDVGPVELRMPRDREGTFEPVTVPKHVRRLEGLGANVLSLYAKGLTTGEIQAHLAEIYDTEVSRETISKITDAVLPDMVAWQSRPLDRRVYPVLLIDAIVVKVRGSQVANRPVYVAIGMNLEGERDILGLWLGPSGGEGAKQWMTMLTELRNRGLLDALIVCCDGLKGLPDAIRVTWPEATVQTCVVHLVRNGLRYASRKYWAKITGEMRDIYTAPTVEAAELRFGEFAENWRGLYPAMIASWENSLARVRTIPRVPRRAQKDRPHHQCHRVAERQVPSGCPSPRAFPQRASRTQGALPRRYNPPTKPREHDRTNPQLEANPQLPSNPLRRQTQHPKLEQHTHMTNKPFTQRN